MAPEYQLLMVIFFIYIYTYILKKKSWVSNKINLQLSMCKSTWTRYEINISRQLYLVHFNVIPRNWRHSIPYYKQSGVRSHDRLIFIMGIPIHIKTFFILRRGLYPTGRVRDILQELQRFICDTHCIAFTGIMNLGGRLGVLTFRELIFNSICWMKRLN